MSSPVIRVENLSKIYRLGRQDVLPNSLVAAATRVLSSPWENFRRLRRLTHFEDADRADDILWALRDVSFEIPQGAVLGVIGRNGSGKSTLLKILSRITTPTRGRIEIHGRLASLLEVGTGFHPELSGRDNIFLNGAILGMTRREIQAKLDEIVAFAEIENFIDTPVKRYSSGMYVRLAFAIAAHLEPEILILDEVLAVGDAQFQKKCLGKMEDVADRDGRTILFVSHNMAAVERLCTETILLERGRLGFHGPTARAVELYAEHQASGKGHHIFPPNSTFHYENEAHIVSVATLDAQGKCQSEFLAGEPFSIRIEYEAVTTLRQGILRCQIRTPHGVPLFTSHWNDCGPIKDVQSGRHSALCHIRDNHLTPGQYFLEIGLADRAIRPIDYKTDDLSFHILEKTEGGVPLRDPRPGYLHFDLDWEVEN
jgi:lipopolysaccharide transport system ATP-binding protein